MPAPHETLRPAVLRWPLRRVAVGVVIRLLYHPHLVLVAEQRQERRILTPQQLGVPVLSTVPHVASAPVAWDGRVGMLCRSAAALRLREQRFVVGLGGLELVRTDHARPRIVAVTIAPRRRRGRLVANHAASPLLLETVWTIAAEVPFVSPQRPVGVEILGCEDVHFERLNSVRRGAAARGAEEPLESVAGGRTVQRADEPLLFRVALDLPRWNRFDVLGVAPHLP